MSRIGISYLKRLQRLKKVGQPAIIVLDRTRLLPIFIPLINRTMKALGVVKQYQRDLNYRLIANSFKNSPLQDVGENAKVILFPFFSGGDNVFLLLNLLIAKHLNKKGYRIVFLICDTSMPVCSNERNLKTRENDPYLCYNCFSPYRIIQESVKGEFLHLSKLCSKKELEVYKADLEKLTTLDELKNFTFEGNPIGEFAYKSMLRFYITGELSGSEDEKRIYRKFLLSLIQHTKAFNQLLTKIPASQIHRIIVYNGTLSAEKIYCHLGEKNGIDYITNETFVGNNTWIYKKNDEIMSLEWEEQWEEFKKQPLTSAQREEAKEFFEGLRYGKNMYAKLNDEHPLDEKLKGKKFVALFSNLNYDTYVLGKNPLFNNITHWIEEVIHFWKENNIEETLVIRVHPGETKLIVATTDYLEPRLRPLVEGCDNIVLYGPDDKVNSYTLIENMSFGLIYASTIGLEIPYYGKSCLVAGDAFFKYRNYTIIPNSVASYFQELKALLLQAELPKHVSQEEILQYVYFLYIERVKRIEGIEMDHTAHKNIFDFKTIDELERKNLEILEQFTAETIA